MATDRRQLGLQIRIGVFVLIALAVFLGLVYFLGRQGRLFEAKYELVTEFTEVAGLTQGATVRLAGVQIGRVTQVLLPGTAGQKVRVTLSIARRFQDRIRADSKARIDTQGLLGDKIIEITLGGKDAPPLKPGEPIAALDPLEVGRLVGEAAEILKNVTALSANLRSTVEAFNRAQALDDLSATLRATRQMTEQIEQGEGILHQMIYDREAGRALKQLARRGQGLARIVEEVEHGKGWLHALIYEEPHILRRLDEVLAATQRLLTQAESGESAAALLFSAESGRAARQLLQAMESLGRAVGKGKESPSLLSAFLFDPQYKSIAEDLRSVARNFRRVSERLSTGRGLLPSLLQDEGDGPLGQAAADFRVAMANLRVITDRLAAGEGTLGGLIEDPTIYENLAAFLEGAQRSLILRSLIRSTVTSGQGKK